MKEWKKKEVEKLNKLIDDYPVIGIINMYKMPASQLQMIRKELKGKANILMSKKSFMKLALEKANKKNVEKLKEYLNGQPTLIFTEMNPFELFKYLKENKTPAPAKTGDIAPNDIVVNKGNTGIPAGPAIGHLSDAGLVSKVQDGKIHVIKNTIVVKEGDVINSSVSNVLNMLGIEPMEIGLNLLVVYENETIFDKKILNIDEEEFMNRVNKCIFSAINLSLNSSYLTKTTAPMAIQKAFMEAKALALEAGIYTKEVMDEIITKAQREVLSLKAITEK
ncbi:MAG: 50S ribosomal protein L10 [Candidatus Aenigmarchaeota archaeon]|nr:50S ribosomal protein L10 [Candidatus Aenigmarchaeota archaeon]